MSCGEVELVERQSAAYKAHEIETFIACFSGDVEIVAVYENRDGLMQTVWSHYPS